MKNKIILALVVLSSFLLGACGATGPTYDQQMSAAKPTAANNGRVYLYRNTIFGAAIKPTIYLNGQSIGKSVANGFTYVDKPAGKYNVSATTEAKRSLSFNLAAGEEKYIRLEMKMGVLAGHVKPVLVDNSVGKEEIKATKFIAE